MDQLLASSIASIQLPVINFSTTAAHDIVIVFNDVVRLYSVVYV